jgi:BASS family bile acid:Na+ symporter
VGGALAIIYPPAWKWVTGSVIEFLLALIMLGMGLTLSLSDLTRVWKQPRGISVGLVLQYSVMPAAGYFCARLFDLDAPLAAGLILVSCCPGGTASNVVTYLARGDVALSVSMTAASTFAGVLTTPLLTSWLVGSRIEVDAFGLLLSTAKVVLLPVFVGLAMRRYLRGLTAWLLPFAPFSAVVAIVLIVGSILGARRDALFASAFSLLAAIVLTHAIGFGCGYIFGRLFSPPPKEIAARTISIEVGMQNSGLGVVLAQANFANPLVALPCAISSLVHCVLGCACAAYWGRRTAKEKSEASALAGNR